MTETAPATAQADRADRAQTFLWGGIALGALAIVFLPIIFAPLAAVCGLLTLYYGRPIAGAGVVVWAFATGVVGFILGVIGFALL